MSYMSKNAKTQRRSQLLRLFYDFYSKSYIPKKNSRQTLHVKRQKKSGDVTALFCVPSATEFDVNNTKKKCFLPSYAIVKKQDNIDIRFFDFIFAL